MMKKSYTITREVYPDRNTIVFSWHDQSSLQELHRDFPQLRRLHKYAWIDPSPDRSPSETT
jgi:hypothetical protein